MTRNGTLDPDEWFTCDDPARLVTMLGGVEANRAKLQVWSDEMDRLWVKELTHGIPSHPRIYQNTLWWLCDVGGEWATNKLKSSLIRCLFASPLIERERDYFDEQHRHIFIDRIDPRWLSSTVIDLVGRVRGESGKWEVVPDDDLVMYRVRWSIPDEQGRYQWVRHYPENLKHAAYREAEEFNAGKRLPRFDRPLPEAKPDFSIMPILADALEDAGCDDEEIGRHCRSGTHVAGCWVIEELQAAIAAGG